MRKTLVAILLGLLLPAVASAKNMYIPAAAFAQGNKGTFWRTDLRIYNPSSEAALDVSLHFLPQGMDGSNISGQVFTIPARGTLVLDNAVKRLWPTVVSAIGAIRIDSDTDFSYPFVATSRTYTSSEDFTRPGTYGQYVPALDPSAANALSAVLGVTSTPEFRTNLGVMNPGREPVTVKMKLLGTNGVEYLESAPLTIPPMSMQQWSLLELFGVVFAQDGTVVIGSTKPVFSWASVIDNRSADAIFVNGIRHDATVTPIPLD